MRRVYRRIGTLLLFVMMILQLCAGIVPAHTVVEAKDSFSLAEVPEYSGSPYVEVHGNQPYFTSSELTTKSYETYSKLDSQGRCGVAVACVGKDLMPTEERGKIGKVKPTGWHTVKYDFIDGKYLYNRCHLIAYELTSENANRRNLITGTRYLNTEGMLSFENVVTEYVEKTSNHVMYRSTPVFEGNNKVASGVLLEAQSVEDDEIQFCVFCYNVQPGVTIDYATGDSESKSNDNASTEITYVINTNTKKFHKPSCSSVDQMKDKNKKETTESREQVINEGYEPCKRCKP